MTKQDVKTRQEGDGVTRVAATWDCRQACADTIVIIVEHPILFILAVSRPVWSCHKNCEWVFSAFDFGSLLDLASCLDVLSGLVRKQRTCAV